MLGAGALAACAPPEFVTQGGPDPFEGGIGGTGIVGTITGSGALMVNGLALSTTAATRVRTALPRGLPDRLGTGQTLTVTAMRTRRGFEARHITIDYALVGEVTRRSGGGFAVNGVAVRLEPGAVGTLVPGARVALSGLWQSDGSLIVSRVDVTPDAPDLVAGTVISTGPGRFMIGAVPIVPRGTVPVNGSYAVAVGRATAAGLDADLLRPGRFLTETPIRQLSIEGYLESDAGRPGFRVAGLGHSFARDLDLAPLAQVRAVYYGSYNGLFGARAAYVLPEGVQARTALLTPGVLERFDGRIVPV